MGFIGSQIGYKLLKTIAPRKPTSNSSVLYTPDTNLPYYFGDDFIDVIQGKTVIDFGCGRGYQAVEMAKRGAGKVIGLDIQEKMLSIGAELAKQSSVDDRCIFTTNTRELADIIVSLDAFEHFLDPAAILQIHAHTAQALRNGADLVRTDLAAPAWGASLFSISLGTSYFY